MIQSISRELFEIKVIERIKWEQSGHELADCLTKTCPFRFKLIQIQKLKNKMCVFVTVIP